MSATTTEHINRKVENPIFDDELKDEGTESLFLDLMDAIYEFNWDGQEAELLSAANELNERICHDVTSKPILAKVVSKECLHWSLLTTACEKLPREWFHPAIKFLIQVNPSALLWKRRDSGESPIHTIAGDHSHYVLMTWIAENYSWVLDHRICQDRPPVFPLLELYASRSLDDDGHCGMVVRQFFEHYPRGLIQEDHNYSGGNPLHKVLTGHEECEESLFKWMAEQQPSNMLNKDRQGHTPLHDACLVLEEGPNEICKFLIAKCPEAIRMTARGKALPIHMLASNCHHRPVPEIAIRLLRAYPESFDMAAESCYPSPISVPFIHRIMPLLEEERGLKENIDVLQETPKNFQKAIVGSQNTMLASTSVSFDSWATSYVHILDSKVQQIAAKLRDACEEFEGQEMEDPDEEMEAFDEEELEEALLGGWFRGDDGGFDGEESSDDGW